MMELKDLGLALALTSVLFAGAAQAQQNDRFTLRIGAMDADASSELTARTQFMGQDYRYSQDFDFGSDEISPRIDGTFRFSERQRLVFDYFQYDKEKTATLDGDLSFDDVTIPAGSFARAEVEFTLASLMYDYAVVNTDTFELGLQIGAEWAKLDGKLLAEAGPYRYQDSEKKDGYAPVVGARFTFTPSEKWLINVQGQYLDADWGDFGDYDGSISRANAAVEYRFTPVFGAFVGYDWFKLDAQRGGRDGSLGLDHRFKGPVAGVSFSF
jgi:opacity protein-like surface antigen